MRFRLVNVTENHASIFAVRLLLVVRSPFLRGLCQANHSSVLCNDESLVEPVFDGESGVTVRVSLCPGDDDNIGLSVTPAFRQS